MAFVVSGKDQVHFFTDSYRSIVLNALATTCELNGFVRTPPTGGYHTQIICAMRLCGEVGV